MTTPRCEFCDVPTGPLEHGVCDRCYYGMRLASAAWREDMRALGIEIGFDRRGRFTREHARKKGE